MAPFYFSERLVELFEEMETVEYDPVHGIQELMGRLERIFWKMEQEGFPVMDDHRIGVLLRTLPRRAREVVHRIWGEFHCSLSYAELRRQIGRHEFPEDLGESGAESEDDEDDPEMEGSEDEAESEPEPEPEAPEEDEDMEVEILEIDDDEEDLEIEDPDEDLEETVEDPDELPEYPAPIVPIPRDDLILTLQLWLLFTLMMLYVLVGRVAPPN